MDSSKEFGLVEEAGVYEIHLQGKLSLGYTEWFEGFEIEPQKGETILRGKIDDQSALHGLLRRIRDLGIPLISVTRISVSKNRGNT